MLLDPRITTALAVQDGRTTLVLLRNDGAGLINRFQIDVGDAEHAGYLALAQRVGEGVLRLLYQAHPDVFAQYQRLVPPMPDTDPHLMALNLIDRATRQRTLAYNGAIDALMPELAHTDMPENWAVVRASLVERYGGS